MPGNNIRESKIPQASRSILLLMLTLVILPCLALAQNADNSITIGWTLSPAITGGYVEIHRRLDSGIYAVINRVPVPRSFYVDGDVRANTQAFSYYLVLYDSNNSQVGQRSNAHQTIFLQPTIPNVCTRVTSLRWNNYVISTTVGTSVTVPGFFTQNTIAVSVNNSDFQVVETLAAASDREMLSTPVAGRYCIRVRSVDANTGVTSSSNIRCMDINFPNQQQFLYVRGVSINENTGAAEIEIYNDVDVPNPFLMVEKYNPVTGDFIQLQTIVPAQQDVVFTDAAALSGERAETYRVTLLDSCGHVARVSPEHSSIYLTARKISNRINQLEWTPYIGWDRGVETYVVQRKLGDAGVFEDIALLPSDRMNFTDEVVSGSDVNYALYRIKAFEALGNPYGFSGEVLSNPVLLEQDVEIFIPNAFNPHSNIAVNIIFKPSFSFASPANYSLTIYNRWGQRIYSTTQPQEGWDGTYSGTPVPAGVYSYVISYRDSSGKEVEKRGALMLVRNQ
jgi:gliding motility-associated-like protein